MVESETVEHLAHVEADHAAGPGDGSSDLPEHGLVVDIDFDEGSVFSIDECEIAICAVEGASV